MLEQKMQLVDWLDDLCVRFIVNLPKEELESVERICFQVEEAQWFYEDFVRPLDPQLPSLNLRQFCLLIFQHCPLFAGYDSNVYLQAFSEFLAYKTRVPVRGAIMLNENMDEVVLVKGWKKNANWSFPRGKINKAERDLDCAIREVYEETGFDLRAGGLVPNDEDVKSIEVTMREQHMKLFVFRGVPQDTYFQPRTRKEISSIQWYKLSDLPTLKKLKQQHQHQEGHGDNLAAHANKFYMVAPFLVPLKKIIAQMRKKDAVKHIDGLQAGPLQDAPMLIPEGVSLEDIAQEKEISGTLSSIPAPNDMDRLLNQLRQSKQASREQNLPEVIQPMVQPGSTTQLMSMLNVPTTQRSISHDGPDFVQILRDAQSTGHRQAVDHASQAQSAFTTPIPPATPFDQVYTQPEMPASPTHQHRLHQNVGPATSDPPPTFPYSSTHIPQSIYTPQSQPLPTFEAPPNPAPWLAGEPQVPIQRARSPAPYQQTGDPDFSMLRSGPSQPGPAVPEPSRLPPPKLTANSAKLLSLFKAEKQPAAPTAAEMSAESSPLTIGNPLLSELASASSQQRRPAPSALPLGPSLNQNPLLTTPTELGPSSPSTNRPKTSQQTALLDLFKSQSGRKSGTPSPALAPAVSLPPPVELSSAQSPGEKRRSGSSEALIPLVGGKVAPQRRLAQPVKASMHATVTGPLNITERDLHQRTASTMTAGNIKILSRPGTSNGQAVGNAAQTSSNLLESPKPAKASPKLAKASPRGGRSPRRARGEPKNTGSPKPPPFQPQQILKRPAPGSATEKGSTAAMAAKDVPLSTPPQILRRQQQLSDGELDLMSPPTATTPTHAQIQLPLRGTPIIERGVVEASSPMSRQVSSATQPEPVSAMTPGDGAFSFGGNLERLDRRESATSEQKASLLSLFKPGAATAPAPAPTSAPTSTAATTPVPGAPPKAASPAPSRGTPALSPLLTGVASLPPRARMGSRASVGSDGRSATPQTSEKDKKFLLGFLNNVVNEGKSG